MIVLGDADLNRAVGACVWGALMNCGQACTSIERVYVESAVYDRFVEKLVARVRATRQGRSEDDVDIGCFTSEEQLNKVAAQVEQAIAQGAKALTGARRNPKLPGYYYEPTVLVDVDHSMTIATEETFGPVSRLSESGTLKKHSGWPMILATALGSRIFSRNKQAWLSRKIYRRARFVSMIP